MSTHDNGPALDGWQLPPRHCGTWCEGYSCTVCGEHAIHMPANIQLGAE